jgi:hypothetical protein
LEAAFCRGVIFLHAGVIFTRDPPCRPGADRADAPSRLRPPLFAPGGIPFTFFRLIDPAKHAPGDAAEENDSEYCAIEFSRTVSL